METTSWSTATLEKTPWIGDSSAQGTVLVDDLVCLVDDPIVLVDGYDPTKHSPIEKIQPTSWV